METDQRKHAWYTPHMLETLLKPEEIKKRLESRTITQEKFKWPTEDIYFSGEIEDKKFYVLVLTNAIPPHGQNPVLPNVSGEIIEDSEGKSIIYIWLEHDIDWKSLTRSVFILWTIVFFYYKVNALIYTGVLYLGYFLVKKYLEFVGRRVVEWLEALLEAKEKI